MPGRAGRVRPTVPIRAESASPRNARAAFEATGTLGQATVRRVYGDFSNCRLARWNAAMRSWSIVPCDQEPHAWGRNAADIALASDAMDPMHREGLEGFVPMPGGSAFTRLARRLREGRLAVCGFGGSKTPRAFRAACHRFEFVGNGAGRRQGRWIRELRR